MQRFVYAKQRIKMLFFLALHKPLADMQNTLMTNKNLKVLPVNINNIQHMHTKSL